MSEAGKPIWSQGMFLRPQHFQQQERYWESFIRDHVSGQSGYGWGLRRLDIDRAALELGRFEVTRFAVTLPDGTPLGAPGISELPPPRIFGAEARGKRVMLALPIRRSDAADVSPVESPGAERRWRRCTVSLRDTSSENDEYCEVQLGRLAPVVLLEGEPRDTYVAMPIARIQIASDTEITLDENYLPPVMNCRIHPGYMRTLRDIRSLLHRRAEHLATQLDPNTAVGMSDMLDFLLLQMMNRHETAFAHMIQLEHLAPERAYVATAALAGELSTFLPDRRAKPPPVYDHADPGPGWRQLVQRVTSALGRVADRHGIELPLQRQSNGARVAAIHDHGLLDSGRFIVVVRSNAPREITAAQIERRLKVCSMESLREIVALQLSGIPCMVVPVVPRGLPYYPDATYLEVDRTAALWEEVRSSGTLAIYMAGAEADFDLRLWGLRGITAVPAPAAQAVQ